MLGYVLGRKVERFRRLSTIDMLTDLPNRRLLESRLQEEWSRSRRYGLPLSLVLIDIDGLKRINDEGGHAAGDRLLRTVADTIKACLRAVDVGARWGGDEFAVLAPNTPMEAARRLADRLLSRMKAESGSLHRAPASLGVATFDAARDSSDTPDALLRRADAALYEAKTGGRHQVREG